jgi:hypothetical protein
MLFLASLLKAGLCYSWPAFRRQVYAILGQPFKWKVYATLRQPFKGKFMLFLANLFLPGMSMMFLASPLSMIMSQVDFSLGTCTELNVVQGNQNSWSTLYSWIE